MRSKKIKILSFMLGLMILCGTMAVQVSAATEASELASVPKTESYIPLTLDGKPVLHQKAILIDSVTYVALRAFCESLGDVSVGWNAKTRTAHMNQNGIETTARDGALYIQSNGRYFYTVTPIMIINDTMYAPIRPLARAFGVTVNWDDKTRSVSLKKTGKMPQSGSSFYNSDDVYWLSRIIHAESGGEPFRGKVAVGNVVINRKNSPAYPSTIYGVIFDRRHGTQFSPILNGSIYHTPSADSVIAAKICLEGYSLSNDILFFMNPAIATNFWIANNRPFAFRIGNHYFYR